MAGGGQRRSTFNAFTLALGSRTFWNNSSFALSAFALSNSAVAFTLWSNSALDLAFTVNNSALTFTLALGAFALFRGSHRDGAPLCAVRCGDEGCVPATLPPPSVPEPARCMLMCMHRHYGKRALLFAPSYA